MTDQKDFHHTHIVKRKEHTEPYDNHKVYASCYAACLSAHILKEKAEDICKKVTEVLDVWIDDKTSVTSDAIFNEVTKELSAHNKEASFLYKTHRDVS